MDCLLAIFAHPDDETFRPGGTLALLAQSGVKVHVLILTHGEAGSCGEPSLCTPDELPIIRTRELLCACVALGIEPPHLLDYPDGHLVEAYSEQVIADILAFIRQVHPQVLVSFGPDGLSGHPDHILVGQWAAEAFQRIEEIDVLYNVAVPQSLAIRLGMKQIHSVPDKTIALSVDVASVWEIKLTAMRCHATQWSSSPMLSAPVERQRQFFGYEYFVRAAIRNSSDDFIPRHLQGYLL
ncbi:MAG: PIG-L family deacetylase [Chloroflexi bacterium]|nr:PIG-L family deacetylase [Chloroflexota bacterium]